MWEYTIPTGAALTVVAYHVFFIIASSITQFALASDLQIKAGAIERLTIRNEIDSFVEIALTVPSLVYTNSVSLFGIVRRNWLYLVGGVITLPMVILLLDYQDKWLVVADIIYEMFYFVLFVPLKLILNTVRLVYDLGVGFTNFLGHLVWGLRDAFTREIVNTLLTYVVKGLKEFVNNFATLVESLMSSLWDFVKLLFDDKKGKLAEVLQFDFLTDKVTESTLSTFKSLEFVVEVWKNFCDRLLGFELTAFPMAIYATLIKENGPALRIIPGVLNVIAAPFKLLRIIAVDLIALLSHSGSGGDHIGSEAVPEYINSTVAADQIENMVFAVGETIDLGLHHLSKALACNLGNTQFYELATPSVEFCMYNSVDKAFTRYTLLYPEDPSVFTAVAGNLYLFTVWLPRILASSFFNIPTLVFNIDHAVGTIAVEIKGPHRSQAYDSPNAISLKRDKTDALDYYHVYRAFRHSYSSLANVASVSPNLRRTHALLDRTVELVSGVGLYLVDSLVSIAVGSYLPNCPTVQTVNRGKAPGGTPDMYYSNNLCACTFHNPLSEIDYMRHRFPYVQPHIDEDGKYVCPNDGELNWSGPGEGTNTQLMFNSIKPCNINNADRQERKNVPPFIVTLSDEKDSLCACHPRRDYTTTSTYCICGTPRCTCSLAYMDTKKANLLCNFDPSELSTAPLPSDDNSNDFTNFCKLPSTAAEARELTLSEQACICEQTFDAPISFTAANGKTVFYCNDICTTRFIEYTNLEKVYYDGHFIDLRYGNDRTLKEYENFTFKLYDVRLSEAYHRNPSYVRDRSSCTCRFNAYVAMYRALNPDTSVQFKPVGTIGYLNLSSGFQVDTKWHYDNDPNIYVERDDTEDTTDSTGTKFKSWDNRLYDRQDFKQDVIVLGRDVNAYLPVIPFDAWEDCTCPFMNRRLHSLNEYKSKSNPFNTYLESDQVLTQCNYQPICPHDATFEQQHMKTYSASFMLDRENYKQGTEAFREPAHHDLPRAFQSFYLYQINQGISGERIDNYGDVADSQIKPLILQQAGRHMYTPVVQPFISCSCPPGTPPMHIYDVFSDADPFESESLIINDARFLCLSAQEAYTGPMINAYHSSTISNAAVRPNLYHQPDGDEQRDRIDCENGYGEKITGENINILVGAPLISVISVFEQDKVKLYIETLSNKSPEIPYTEKTISLSFTLSGSDIAADEPGYTHYILMSDRQDGDEPSITIDITSSHFKTSRPVLYDGSIIIYQSYCRKDDNPYMLCFIYRNIYFEPFYRKIGRPSRINYPEVREIEPGYWNVIIVKDAYAEHCGQMVVDSYKNKVFTMCVANNKINRIDISDLLRLDGIDVHRKSRLIDVTSSDASNKQLDISSNVGFDSIHVSSAPIHRLYYICVDRNLHLQAENISQIKISPHDPLSASAPPFPGAPTRRLLQDRIVPQTPLEQVNLGECDGSPMVASRSSTSETVVWFINDDDGNTISFNAASITQGEVDADITAELTTLEPKSINGYVRRLRDSKVPTASLWHENEKYDGLLCMLVELDQQQAYEYYDQKGNVHQAVGTNSLQVHDVLNSRPTPLCEVMIDYKLGGDNPEPISIIHDALGNIHVLFSGSEIVALKVTFNDQTNELYCELHSAKRLYKPGAEFDEVFGMAILPPYDYHADFIGTLVVWDKTKTCKYRSEKKKGEAETVSSRRHLLQTDGEEAPSQGGSGAPRDGIVSGDIDNVYTLNGLCKDAEQPCDVLFTTDDGVLKRLDSALAHESRYLLQPFLRVADALEDWFRGGNGFGIVSLAEVLSSFVRFVARLIDALVYFTYQLVRGGDIDETGIIQRLAMTFHNAKIALVHVPNVISELLGVVVGLSGGVTGMDDALCRETRVPNIMLTSSLKVYSLVEGSCSAAPSPLSTPFMCDIADARDGKQCQAIYSPFHDLNTNPLCAMTEYTASVVSIVTVVTEAVVAYLFEELIHVFSCFPYYQGSNHAGLKKKKTCNLKGLLMFPEEVFDMLECGTFELSVRYGAIIATFTDAIAFLIYGNVAERESETGEDVRLPINCTTVPNMLTCSEIGAGARATEGAVKAWQSLNHLFAVRSNPICAYNLLNDTCINACELYPVGQCDKSPTIYSPVDGENVHYCVGSQSACVRNSALDKIKHIPHYADIQEFPIQAGTQTFVASSVSFTTYIVLTLKDALRTVLMLDTTNDGEYTLTKDDAFGEFDKMLAYRGFRVVLLGVRGVVLYVRDQLVSLLMVARGYSLALTTVHNDQSFQRREAKFQADIMKFVSIIEELVNVLTDALAKLISATIEFILRLVVAFGRGIATPEEMKKLGEALWSILKDYGEFVVHLAKSIFINTNLGKYFQTIANDLCNIMDKVSGFINQVAQATCNVMESRWVRWAVSTPAWCTNIASYKSFSGKCDLGFPTSSGTAPEYEATVCYDQSVAQAKCKSCVARSAYECQNSHQSGGGSTLIVDSSEWVASCPCNSCINGEYYCDIGAGLCVCGSERQFLTQNLMNKVVDTSEPVKITRDTWAKEALVSNRKLYESFCLAEKVWDSDYASSLPPANDIMNRYDYIQHNIISQRQDFADDDKEILCRAYCSSHESNDFNELFVRHDGNVVCVLNAYRDMAVEAVRSNFITVRKLVTTPTASPTRRRLLGVSNSTTIGGGSLVIASTTEEGCDTHGDCMDANAMCSNWELQWSMPCSSCNLGRRYCDAHDNQCKCGAPPERDWGSMMTSATSLSDWGDLQYVANASTWQGGSHCDMLVRAYGDNITLAPSSLSPLETSVLQQCLQKRMYGHVARSLLGIPTLPIGIFYDPIDALYAGVSAAYAVAVSTQVPVNSSDEDVFRIMQESGVDPYMGTRVYQLAGDMVSALWNTVSFNGTMQSISRAVSLVDGSTGEILRDIGDAATSAIELSSHSMADAPDSLVNMAVHAFELMHTAHVQDDATTVSRRRLLSYNTPFPRRGPTLRTVGNMNEVAQRTTEDKEFTTDFINKVIGQCRVIGITLQNFYASGAEMKEYYSKNFKHSLLDIGHAYAGLVKPNYDPFKDRINYRPSEYRVDSDKDLSMTTVVFDVVQGMFNVSERMAIFKRSRRTGEPISSKVKAEYVAQPIDDMYNQTLPSAPDSIREGRRGLTHDVASGIQSVTGWNSRKAAYSMTNDMLRKGFEDKKERGFFGFLRRLFICNHDTQLECSKDGMRPLLEAIVVVFILDLMVVYGYRVLTPEPIREIVSSSLVLNMGIYATRIGFNISMLLLVGYNISPVCIFGYKGETRISYLPLPTSMATAVRPYMPNSNNDGFSDIIKYASGLDFDVDMVNEFLAVNEVNVALVPFPAFLPYCLFDDLYDLVDVFVLPRHPRWGDKLIKRHRGKVLSDKEAKAALDCVDTHGFHDGVSSLAYIIQRLAGDDYQDKVPWVRYLRVYPFTDMFTAFEGLTLSTDKGDEGAEVREACFVLTMPGLLPVMLFGSFAVTLQFYLFYAAWAFATATFVLTRDIRNSAILFGVRNDQIKEMYARGVAD